MPSKKKDDLPKPLPLTKPLAKEPSNEEILDKVNGFTKLINDTKLWVVSKRCGDFNTEVIVSIMDKYDSDLELTEKQVSCLENIYEKCEIERKVSKFSDYSVEHLSNMEVESPPVCCVNKCPCVEWSVFKDGKYYSANAFSEKVNITYPRKIFVDKSK